MKTIFNSNSEICHVFAQRTQNHGRTSSGNLYFDNNRIYSYGKHYLLAEFLNNDTILINDIGYSSSTGKHINLIIQATRQYKQYFTTNVDLDCVYNIIMDNNDKLQRAKKPEIYISVILSKFDSLTEFLKEFKQVNSLKSDKYKEIKKIYNSLSKNKEKYLEQAKERERKAREKAKIKLNEQLEKFFNYEVNYINSGILKEDFLRISKDKTMIETTQQVKVSIQEAKKLYHLIETNQNIKGYRIDNYIVISLNGVLKIGCHNINRKNVTEIGEKIKNL